MDRALRKKFFRATIGFFLERGPARGRLADGFLAGVAGYKAMFAVSAACGVVGWLLLRFSVREPRQAAVAP